MDDFWKGWFVGAAQVVSGHPFDTYKTWSQTDIKHVVSKKDAVNKFSLNLINLNRGILSPLLSTGIYNAVLFKTYSTMKENDFNPVISGLVAGLASGPVLTMVDAIKIYHQNLLKEKPRLLRGVMATTALEGPATVAYFGVYEAMRAQGAHALLAGGAAGMAAWLVIYPLDVVKTRMQADYKLTYRQAFQQGHLWRGLAPCLVRASITNAVGFYVYEFLSKNGLP